MLATIRGLGTVINVAAVLVGGTAGILVGHRLPQRTRDVVTDALGLITLLAAGLSAVDVTNIDLRRAVGRGVPVLVVLGAVVVGAIVGSLADIERRLEGVGAAIHRLTDRTAANAAGASGTDAAHAHRHEARRRFVDGWLTASLVFCVGPMTILGSLDDGLGRGIETLVLKSTLDGFAAMAFATTYGAGVLASAATIAVVQGGLTALGWTLGSLLPPAHLAALTATGAVLLAGVGLRLLRLKELRVGDMLPALVIAPLLTELIVRLR